jgi:hypothetical protein
MRTAAALLAAAILGASAVQAEEATTTTQVVNPYFAPVAVAPVTLDADTLKALIEYQQKAYQYYLQVQQQIAASTPDYLRIPPIPQLPAFDQRAFLGPFAMDPAMQQAMDRQRAEVAAQMQRAAAGPYTVNIDQTFAERKKQIDDNLQSAQERLTDRQKTLDSAEKAL